MPVRVARGLKTRIREDPGGIVVQVRECPAMEVAAGALQRAGAEIARLDGGWKSAPGLSPGDTNGPTFVSGVTEAPTGPFITVDGGYTPLALLASIPDIVARHLAEAGVDEAVVGWPKEQSPISRSNPEGIYGLGPAVMLHLYPPPVPRGLPPRPFAQVPAQWASEAAAWVNAGRGASEEVWAELPGVCFPLRAGDAAGLYEQCRLKRRIVRLTAGGPGRARVAYSNFILDQGVSLGSGGPEVSGADLARIVEDLAVVARRLAPTLAYSYIRIEGRFFIPPTSVTGWSWAGGASSMSVQRLCDEIVADGFPVQVLGPGHLARLGDNLERFEGARAEPLGGGKVEVRIGDAEDWLVEFGDAGDWLVGPPRREAVQALARDVLALCLISDQEAIDLEHGGGSTGGR